MPTFYKLSANRILRRTGRLPQLPCNSRAYVQKIVKENDVVLLKNRNSPSAPIITQKLRAGHRTLLSKTKDAVQNDHIIGKGLRDIVISKRGNLFRILEPTLAEYTDNFPRLVTPIYSQDANLIVSLLDLHPTPPQPNATDEEKLEIFEAGTGHGALTLHLARAIHAANPPPPILEPPALPTEEKNAQVEQDLKPDGKWREARRAVIHSLDNNPVNSAHAEHVVKNFRNGLYYPDVDFHRGTIEDYLSARLVSTDEPFLDHAILDLPSTHSYFEIVCKAMKMHGMLISFCPSITQINTCVLLAKQKDLPLYLEKVIEIGAMNGVGGREWDVRQVTPRALTNGSREQREETDDIEGVPEDRKIQETSTSGETMVCRPKVGAKITGGGFLGVWRKVSTFSQGT